MQHWKAGYTPSQLDDIQAKFGLRFPPDLIDLYLDRRPSAKDACDWLGNEEIVQARLQWPLESILFDVRHNIWWDHWGDRPRAMADREDVVRQLVANAPKLIPILSHRFIPETPHERDNPVFSVYQTDIICYGANLEHYFLMEFGPRRDWPWPPIKRIPFWSDFTDGESRWFEVEERT